MKPAKFVTAVSVLGMAVLSSCATVDVTKTGKGAYAATVADDVEILMTKPDRSFTELGAITVSGWHPSATAKMHNALRTKAAPLGANAVILLNTGLDVNGQLWGNGVAIRWN